MFECYLAVNRANGKEYVGITARGIRLRWWEHCNNARVGGRGALYRALRKYGREAFDVYCIGEAVDRAALLALEIRMIERLQPAYNMTRGGESTLGIVLSAETRARMSAAKKGRPKSEETRQRMRDAWKRRTPEFLASLAEANRRRAQDPAIRAKISASHATRSPEYRAKLSAAHKGRKHSAEHVANNRAAQRRRFEKGGDE